MKGREQSGRHVAVLSQGCLLGVDQGGQGGEANGENTRGREQSGRRVAALSQGCLLGEDQGG